MEFDVGIVLGSMLCFVYVVYSMFVRCYVYGEWYDEVGRVGSGGVWVDWYCCVCVVGC